LIFAIIYIFFRKNAGGSGATQRVTVGGTDKGVLKTYFGDDEAPGIKV
jgi:hypothetical protein